MMNRDTGRTMTSEREHIAQCVGDILTTPVGTRVMRRDYGSHIHTLVDQPGHAPNVLRLIAAATDAVERWETRVRVERGAVTVGFDGRAVLGLTCRLVSTGATVVIDTVLGAVQ